MLNQAAVAAITCVCALLAFPLVAAEVKPAQSFLLAPLYAGSEDNQGTLAFLPNGNVAALLCSGALRSRDCTLVLFRGANNRLEVVTASHDPLLSQFHGDIYGLADSRVFVGLRRGGAIFSPDLLTVFKTDIQTIPPARYGNLFGVLDAGSWRLLRLKQTDFEQVAQGAGELLSISGEAVSYRAGDTLVTANLANRQFGAFRLTCPANLGIRADFAGPDRLLLNDCKRDNTLTSFQGREIIKLGPDNGWGFRYGWSADYSRISFDTYTRRILPVQKFSEAVSAVITGLAGLGAADQSSTGESIRVVDTLTGKRCFGLDIPDLSLGSSGTYHADIDPSGRWLAVVSKRSLDVYPLPKVCRGDGPAH